MVDTKVVVRGLPFQSTLDVMVKFAPKRSRVNEGPFTNPDVGKNEFRIGAGVPATVNAGPDTVPVPTPGVATLITTVPAVATSVALIAACSKVLDANVVERGLPFHWTTEVFRKFVPVTLSVNPALPAGTELGLRDAICGTGVGVGVGVGVGGGVDDPPPQPAIQAKLAMQTSSASNCKPFVNRGFRYRGLLFTGTNIREEEFAATAISSLATRQQRVVV